MANSTPPRSRASSRSNLSLDLSDLPPLVAPAPPSNTLLVTNLNDPTIFASQTIEKLQKLICDSLQTAVDFQHASSQQPLTEQDRLHTFSPLPSMRRIVLTFTTTAAAFYIRGVLDGNALASGDRVRVFFGAETDLEKLDQDRQRLQAPKAQKQFFISPPPSPPAGWAMRNEDPPNKDVHATDLTSALEQIGRRLNVSDEVPEPMDVDVPETLSTPDQRVRSRADSRTIVFHPEEQGHSPDLPAIAVEDTSEEFAPEDGMQTKIMAHTARPPVELMS
ncbi:MAG: hypothetical protein Q9159_006587 [Coniocarpon cinnabarinum]